MTAAHTAGTAAIYARLSVVCRECKELRVNLCKVIYSVCYSWTEFPAGEVIKCLIGLGNNGKNDFIVELVEASLR